MSITLAPTLSYIWGRWPLNRPVVSCARPVVVFAHFSWLFKLPTDTGHTASPRGTAVTSSAVMFDDKQVCLDTPPLVPATAPLGTLLFF